MSNGGDPRIKLWSIILIAGSSMMFLAFFMPWWGISITMPGISKNPSEDDRKDYEEEIKDISKQLDKDEKKYKDILGEERVDDLKDDLREGAKQHREDLQNQKSASSYTVSSWIFGWSTGVGITGFILSFFLLAAGIVPLFVSLLRRWMWTGYYAVAVMGLVMFILSLVWYFTTPGKNVKGLSQGVGWYPGPYFEIVGSLAVLVAGVLGGVFGLVHFLNSRKAAAADAGPEGEFAVE